MKAVRLERFYEAENFNQRIRDCSTKNTGNKVFVPMLSERMSNLQQIEVKLFSTMLINLCIILQIDSLLMKISWIYLAINLKRPGKDNDFILKTLKFTFSTFQHQVKAYFDWMCLDFEKSEMLGYSRVVSLGRFLLIVKQNRIYKVNIYQSLRISVANY
ncbi:unnamed protein product [Debaryomyces fabryi]|nr:unnamed protein product [Debaryomyces fabryi]